MDFGDWGLGIGGLGVGGGGATPKAQNQPPQTPHPK